MFFTVLLRALLGDDPLAAGARVPQAPGQGGRGSAPGRALSLVLTPVAAAAAAPTPPTATPAPAAAAAPATTATTAPSPSSSLDSRDSNLRGYIHACNPLAREIPFDFFPRPFWTAEPRMTQAPVCFRKKDVCLFFRLCIAVSLALKDLSLKQLQDTQIHIHTLTPSLDTYTTYSVYNAWIIRVLIARGERSAARLSFSREFLACFFFFAWLHATIGYIGGYIGTGVPRARVQHTNLWLVRICFYFFFPRFFADSVRFSGTSHSDVHFLSSCRASPPAARERFLPVFTPETRKFFRFFPSFFFVNRIRACGAPWCFFLRHCFLRPKEVCEVVRLGVKDSLAISVDFYQKLCKTRDFMLLGMCRL